MRTIPSTALMTRLAASALAVAAACGGAPAPGDLEMIAGEAMLTSTNGLSTNGLSTNGMSTNGMSSNGLSSNGLSSNGLSTSGFSTWFLSQPASYSDMVMRYVVRCALPAGQSLSYTTGGVTFTWAGVLGLAPTWASGSAIPESEQQLISACLAAHANKYGVQMDISVRGYKANGSFISVSDNENATYSVEEGCFFGNLFDGTGVFSAYGANSALIHPNKTSQRACAISGGVLGDCLPMASTGTTCQQICTGNSSYISSYFEFTSCAWNGKNYKPISTRLSLAEITTSP